MINLPYLLLINLIKTGTKSVKVLVTDVSLPNSVSPVFKANRCIGNDSGQKTLNATDLTYCAFCLRRDADLRSCKRCMTATYCGKECQKMHWRKHKYFCKAVGEKNAIEVSLPDGEYSMTSVGTYWSWFMHPLPQETEAVLL